MTSTFKSSLISFLHYTPRIDEANKERRSIPGRSNSKSKGMESKNTWDILEMNVITLQGEKVGVQMGGGSSQIPTSQG